ncbi:MAG: SIS domain-containing protein, partial [Verrucomicrobiales bacterium]
EILMGKEIDIPESAKKVFDIEIAGLESLRDRLDGDFSMAVETLRACLAAEKKIIVVGVGKCSHVADKIAATLTSTGAPAVALNSMNAMHGDLGIVRDGDVVLALSYSGETEAMLDLLTALRRFEVGIISMTGNPESSLARYSDVVLNVRVDREACPLELAPTASTTAMLVMGDALAMVLLEASGFRHEDFARYHPGGTLGRKLLMTACEMMRPRDRAAIVTGDQRVADALESMIRSRAGAALVVSRESGALEGIFTHGDFVRAFHREGAEVSARSVDQLMTRDPVTTLGERLAVEILGVLKEHCIDEVVVVDRNGRPEGIIDVQDLARLGIL